MKYCYLFLLLAVTEIASAQIWVPSRIGDMPMAVSNNAVCGAVVNLTPYMYSFGGIDSTKLYSGITQASYKWSFAGSGWSAIPPLPDTLGKIAAAASNVKGKIYIIGGYHVYSNNSEKSSVRVHRFEPVADTFLTDGMDLPFAIDDQVQCVWRDSLIYVISGWSNVGNVNYVQVYNPSNNTWAQATAVPNNNWPVFGGQGVIRHDTIYYYGGARMGANFPAQSILRIGVIDSMNPTTINWLPVQYYAGHPLYRMIALANPDGDISFLGGSAISYNYNGIAYANNQGVPLANEQIVYNTNSQTFTSDYSQQFPMDLRGYAELSNITKFICGGMLDSQQVTNHAYRLDYYKTVGISYLAKELGIQVYPIPAMNELNIYIEREATSLNYQLLNSVGQKVAFGKILSGKNTIDVSKEALGIYYLIFESQDGRFAEQVIKK